ncbi:hypothetical protein FQR65_LT20142 [Abscondita terminalis]|nr:hypothetical protein FQR65_LT20142 [Abscondita terminalis]
MHIPNFRPGERIPDVTTCSRAIRKQLHLQTGDWWGDGPERAPPSAWYASWLEKRRTFLFGKSNILPNLHLRRTHFISLRNPKLSVWSGLEALASFGARAVDGYRRTPESTDHGKRLPERSRRCGKHDSSTAFNCCLDGTRTEKAFKDARTQTRTGFLPRNASFRIPRAFDSMSTNFPRC